MRVCFRVDSSSAMGVGHLMRCLTLANRLRIEGAEILFICRELRGNLNGFIEQQGFKVYRLPLPQGTIDVPSKNKHTQWLGVDWQVDAGQTAEILAQENGTVDWLIVDSYALDQEWESWMRPWVRHIMVIDDMANRAHDCDLLLDQNFYENAEFRYEGLTPPRCRRLLGPRYALLRPEFLAARQALRKRDGRIRRILISFGGSDPTNETAKAIAAVRQLHRLDIVLDVVVGSANPHREQIQTLCAALPGAICHCPATNMAELIAAADLSIGAGGTTTWERFCLGLPAIVVVIADNQKETAGCLAKMGAIYYAGTNGVDVTNNLISLLNRIIADRSSNLEVSQMCAGLVDGRGCERLLQSLMPSD